MPVWEVSKPYINLWLYDTPLAYRPGLGYPISFKLAYKQRDAKTISSNPSLFSFGPNWNCSWLSYVTDDDPSNLEATLVLPDGGERSYIADNATREFFSHTLLQRTTNASGDLTGFILSQTDGATDYYQFVTNVDLDSHQVAFLSAKVNQFGHTNRFVYEEAEGGVVRLTRVIDADGRASTLSYGVGVLTNRILSVQDPFGHTATLQYDETGLLTNITDAAGLSSSFNYDLNGWITNLATPYGLTTFEHFVDFMGPGHEFDEGINPYMFIRALRVADAAGGTNLYMLRGSRTQYRSLPPMARPITSPFCPTATTTRASCPPMMLCPSD